MEPTKEYGWRFLRRGELRQSGDQWFEEGEWHDCTITVGNKIGQGAMPVRRRIDPGEGWELVPVDEKFIGEVQATDDGVTWGRTQEWISGMWTVAELAKGQRRLAYRRRKQSEWIEFKTQEPEIGARIWFYHTTHGVGLLPCYAGHLIIGVTHWRTVNPNEATPQPPVVKKSQEELDREASAKWYRSDSDNEDTLCEQALRQAYEAGLRQGRAK